MARFKIDENLPIEVAEMLKAAGHDAMTIFEQSMVGDLDSKVASVCKAEDRTPITLDLDFSDIRTYSPNSAMRLVAMKDLESLTKPPGKLQRNTRRLVTPSEPSRRKD